MERNMKTRNHFKFLINVAGWSGVLFILMQFAYADDVYNFYFQKGAAPQTVIQGAGGQAAQASPVANPSPIGGPIEAVVVPSPTPALAPVIAAQGPASTPDSGLLGYQRFHLSLGYGKIQDAVDKNNVVTMGVQYNFNRYLGIKAEVHSVLEDTEAMRGREGYGSSIAPSVRNDSTYKYGGSLALVFTPFHLDFVGHRFFDISLLAGVRSQRNNHQTQGFYYAYPTDWGPPVTYEDVPWGEPYTSSVTYAHVGFVGAMASVSINDNVALEASLHVTDNGKHGAANGALAFRF